MGYEHSVKVPTQYRRTAKVLKTAFESQKSLKSLIYEEKHANLRGMQAVLKKYVDNRGVIDAAIERSKIQEENPQLCKYLCKILVTELLIGRKEIKGESKPVLTVKKYQKRLLEALGGEESLPATNKTELRPRYLRLNTHLLSLEDAIQMLTAEEWRQKDVTRFDYNEFLKSIKNMAEDEFIVDMHVENLLIFHPVQKHYWACHERVQTKQMLLQDKGTCLVAELLRPPAGSIILDMCAAPGMKTIHISNVIKNTGTIYAVEQDVQRYRTMAQMLEATSCTNVKPINADALRVTAEQCPNVEYILVDPSCSGSGMQNRMSLKPEKKDDQRLYKLQGLQIKLLSHAMKNFPNVKRIAYSTCSVYEEENEQVVQRCLEMCPDFKQLSGKKALINKWNNTGNSKYKNVGKKCLYSLPETDYTDGIFIAIFEKLSISE